MAEKKVLDLAMNTGPLRQGSMSARSSIGLLSSAARNLNGILGGLAATFVAFQGIQFLSSSIQEAKEFEDQMAEIEKLTSRGFGDKFGRQIQMMSDRLPLAREELTQTATRALRLGVRGSKNLEKFTTTIGKVTVATDLMADEAANNFARILTLTNENVDAVDNLGATINVLGNTMATSQSEITESMLRSAGAAETFGLQTKHIVAMNAAMNEVSVSARRAGTKTRRFFQELTNPKKVQTFADVLGMSVDQFRAMRKESPDEILLELGKIMEEDAGKARKLRSEVGTRVRKALSGLGANIDGVREALGRANEEWDNATSLNREFQIQAETTASREKLLNNRIQNVQTSLGQELMPAYRRIIEASLGWARATNQVVFGLTELNTKLEQKVGTENLNEIVSTMEQINTQAERMGRTGFQEGKGLVGAPFKEDEIAKLKSFVLGELKEIPAELRGEVADDLTEVLTSSMEQGITDLSKLKGRLKQTIEGSWGPAIKEAMGNAGEQGASELASRSQFKLKALFGTQSAKDALEPFMGEWERLFELAADQGMSGLAEELRRSKKVQDVIAALPEGISFEDFAREFEQKSSKKVISALARLARKVEKDAKASGKQVGGDFGKGFAEGVKEASKLPELFDPVKASQFQREGPLSQVGLKELKRLQRTEAGLTGREKRRLQHLEGTKKGRLRSRGLDLKQDFQDGVISAEEYRKKIQEVNSEITQMSEEQNKAGDEIKGMMELAQDELKNFEERFASAMSRMVLDGEMSFEKLADAFIQNFLQRAITELVTSPIVNAVSSYATGGGGSNSGGDATNEQTGGFLRKKRPAVVGERGPELFVPERSGRVVPNHALRNPRGRGGGGGATGVTIRIFTSSGEGEGENVRTKKKKNGRQEMLDVLLGAVADNIASKGKVAQSLEAHYNVKPQGGRS